MGYDEFMPMDLEILRALYARCRDEPLDPEDDRNVDFDHRDGFAVRGVSWVERLKRPILLSQEPTLQLITGLPGSGKSTELRRLEAHLRGSLEEPGHLVARVDAEEAFDLTQPIDLPDVIAILVHAAEQAVLVAEGAPADAAEPSYLTRLWSWLQNTDATLRDLEIDGGAAKLSFEMKTRPDFRQQVRASLTRHFTKFLRDARAELISLDARAKKAGWRSLCLILDSLEKLRGLASNWEPVLESAERVFGSGAPHLRLPVHTMLTVPPALVSRLNVDVEFMPMVKLRDPQGRRFEAGFSALRELVRRRVDDLELEQLLGAEFETVVEELIVRTGGYPRELVRALQWLIELPEHPATGSDLARLRNEGQERYRALITDDLVPWLARVASEKSLPIRNEKDRPMVDRALQNNIVLRYLNDTTWFDLHPAVLDLPAISSAIQGIRQD